MRTSSTNRPESTGHALALLSWLQVPAVVVLAVIADVPRALMLPLLSLILLAEAAVVLLFVDSTRSVARERLSRRAVAGFLAFLGFGAALLSDPGEVLPLLRGAGRE